MPEEEQEEEGQFVTGNCSVKRRRQLGKVMGGHQTRKCERVFLF